MDEEAHLKQMKLLGELDYEQVRRRVQSRQLSVNTVVNFSRKYYKCYYTYEVDRSTTIQVTILNMAIRFSDEDFVDYLLAKKADVSLSTKDMGPVIFSAVHMRSLKFVEKLVTAGANVNQKRYESAVFKMNHTPLEMAAEMNAQEVARFLIKKGAAVNNQHEVFPHTLPLLAALRYDNALMTQLLVDSGANINKVTVSKGQVTFPLKACVVSKHKFKRNQQAMEILLKNPTIRLDNRDETNRTALHLAMENGNPEVLQKLLDAGCDVNLLDRKNQLPVDVDTSEKCCFIIQQHIVKLIIAEFDLSTGNLDVVSEDFQFREKCEEEIQIMKSSCDPLTGLSCFDLLKKPLEHIARKMKKLSNKDVEMLTVNFPLYGNMLVYKLERAQGYKDLREAAQEILKRVFRELPQKFCRNLVEFFNPEELVVIKALER